MENFFQILKFWQNPLNHSPYYGRYFYTMKLFPVNFFIALQHSSDIFSSSNKCEQVNNE